MSDTFWGDFVARLETLHALSAADIEGASAMISAKRDEIEATIDDPETVAALKRLNAKIATENLAFEEVTRGDRVLSDEEKVSMCDPSLILEHFRDMMEIIAGGAAEPATDSRGDGEKKE